jgi:transposase
MSLLSRELTALEIAELERLANARSAEHRLVERARMVLAANRSRHICDVVRALQVDKDTIRMWGERYIEEGFEGLHDRPRSGHPVKYGPEERATVIACALTPPSEFGLPFGEWTLVRLADYLKSHKGLPMSPARVGVVLREEGLHWQRQEKWLTYRATLDEDFVEKRGPLSGHTPKRQPTV